jgi:uncharacterized protein YukE
MTQIHVDPDKLHEFATKLQGFAKKTSGRIRELKGQLKRLQGTWGDDQYEQFVAEIAVTQRLVERFVDEANKVAPLLRRDAEAVKEYQRHKL